MGELLVYPYSGSLIAMAAASSILSCMGTLDHLIFLRNIPHLLLTGRSRRRWLSTLFVTARGTSSHAPPRRARAFTTAWRSLSKASLKSELEPAGGGWAAFPQDRRLSGPAGLSRRCGRFRAGACVFAFRSPAGESLTGRRCASDNYSGVIRHDRWPQGVLVWRRRQGCCSTPSAGGCGRRPAAV